MKLTENQETYLRLFKEFIAQEVEPRLKELNERDEYPLWMRDRMAELGFTRLTVSEEYDGLGEGMQTLLLLVMEAAKYNNNLASLVNCSNNANKLLSFANRQQIEAFLPPILDEGRFMGMAFTEASGGSDSRAIQTRAVLDGDEWVINGTKSFVSYRSAVGSWQVSARTVDENGKEGISVFLVAADAPGISYGTHYDKYGWCGSDTGDVYFKDCRVPKWSLCGELNRGLRISLGTLDGARLVIAARSLGYARAAFEKSLDYAQNRIAFGKRLTEFQALQHDIAEMFTSIEVGEGYVMHLAAQLDEGENIGKGASIAKLFCTEASEKVCRSAIQLCGGMGLLKDFGLGRYYEDARILTIGEGTSEIQKNIIFKSIMAER